MSYGMDYRRRVVSFVSEGGSKRGAARLFKVSPNTIYEWLKRGDDLAPRIARTRRRKIDKEALVRHVRDNPDALLRERAAHFGVHVNAVWEAMRRQRFVKKNSDDFQSAVI
jgi:transposase